MRSLFFLTILFIHCGSDTRAGGFELSFGGQGTQVCNGIAIGPDSNIYMLGYTSDGPLGMNDFMLAKVSMDGIVLWTQYYGSSESELGISIVFDQQGRLVLAGNLFDPFNGTQVLLIIADTAGNQITQYVYGTANNENINSIRNTPDGGFVLSGFQSIGPTNHSYILKLDSAFNESWTSSQSAGINDYATDAIMHSGSSVYAASDRRFDLGGGNLDYDVCVVRTDSAGILISDSSYFDPFQNGTQAIIERSDGSIVVCGETEIFLFSPFEYFIMAFDTSTGLLWRKTFGGAGANAMFDIVEDSNGNLIGTGYGNTVSAGVDPINLTIIKTDDQGNMLWQREFGGSSIDIGYSIRIAPDGSYVAGGQTTVPGDIDFYLVKTDTSGIITGSHGSPVYHSGIIVYPNPVTERSKFIAPAGFDHIRILDITGRVIFESNSNGLPDIPYDMPLHDDMKGIIILELSDRNNAVYRKKLMGH